MPQSFGRFGGMGSLKKMMTHRRGGTFGGFAFARLMATTESTGDLSEMTR